MKLTKIVKTWLRTLQYHCWYQISGSYRLLIPNGNIINDCGENVHFRLLKCGVFDPKKGKIIKIIKTCARAPYYHCWNQISGSYPLMIPNGNIINDCGENVHFRLLTFGVFDPKKAKSSKSLKHVLEHLIIIVDTKYRDPIP